VQGLTFGRGSDAALASLEQRHAAVLLKLGNALACRRERNTESVRARGQASAIDNCDKKSQRDEIETIQVDHCGWI
jgi:hypothetical protein